MPTLRLIVCSLLVCLMALQARANVLTNSGFETIRDGSTFDGWIHTGNVFLATDFVESGLRSAKVFGPFIGQWAISGAAQETTASPGDVWVGEVSVLHPSGDPLVGDARAILNVEWRDSGGNLIDFDSIPILSPDDPTDTWQRHFVRSSPAPAGTVATRILVGFLQSPANEPGSVRFDRASFELETEPYDPVQWTDFGSRIIEWSGYRWRVKAGTHGPGPNVFSDSPETVWVDAQGRLHLRIWNDGGQWVVPEITLVDELGYGNYEFLTEGRVDEFDPNAILGLFIWEYQTDYSGIDSENVANEFDIEFSRWGDPFNPNNAQFVAQPYHRPGNLSGFDLNLNNPTDRVRGEFSWEPDIVRCKMWTSVSPYIVDFLLHDFDYAGPDIPEPAPRVHINFWLLFGSAPQSGLEQEAVLVSFTHTPLCGDLYCEACDGDANGDSGVDVNDISYVLFRLGDPGPDGDANGDGSVDVNDISYVLFRLGDSCGALAKLLAWQPRQ